MNQLKFGSSPYNTESEYAPPSLEGRKIKITDVTLREGEQAAEVAFSAADKAEVAAGLAEAGVPIVQVGYAGRDNDAMKQVRERCPGLDVAALVVGWSPDAETAISSAFDSGATVCSLLFRSSPSHLANLGFTVASAQSRIQQLAEHAGRVGYPDIVFGPSFATLAKWDTLSKLYRSAVQGGANVISVADSTGIAAPWAMKEIVGRMRALEPGIAVRVHTHNDYGLALQNALASIEAGADWVEASINGLGERAGNCSLDELVVALNALYDYDAGVDTTKLTGLSRLVANLSNVKVPPMKPIVGENCFTNKLEIHVKAAASNPELMEPFDPALIGGERAIKLGRGTGPTGVKYRSSSIGYELTEDEVEYLVDWVNRYAVEHKLAIDDGTLREEIQWLRKKN